MRILFLCTHNACRSILGEAIAQEALGSQHIVKSAGSNPRGVVHPVALNYLASLGLLTKTHTSQSWDEYADFNPDWVITLCDNAAQEVCPAWIGSTQKLHWPLVDPSKMETTQKQQRACEIAAQIIRGNIKTLVSGQIKPEAKTPETKTETKTGTA